MLSLKKYTLQRTVVRAPPKEKDVEKQEVMEDEDEREKKEESTALEAQQPER